MVFNHSVKVPTQYRKAAAVLRNASRDKKSVKTLIYEEQHARKNHLLALMSKYSDNRREIEDAIELTGILTNNPRLDPSLCRILVTELLFGTGKLSGEKAKPVAYVLQYKEKLLETLGGPSESVVRSSSSKVSKPRYVRVNTNLLSIEEAFDILADEGWKRKERSSDNYDEFMEAIKNLDEQEYIVDINIPSLLIFASKWKNYWAFHRLVAEMKFLLQDRATCVVSKLLNPQPNSVILDMCAAPGMKTIHLSNLIQNTGKIYAVEQDRVRYGMLQKMVQGANAICVETILFDALQISNECCPDVEYILVDPSCSGSGMQSRLSIHYNEGRDERRLRTLAALQRRMIIHAMTAFPKVKRIVYSTCSLDEKENEEVVQKCLQACENFKLLNAKKCLERKWNNVGNKGYMGIGKNCLYSLPEKDLTDGIFMAVFERINNE